MLLFPAWILRSLVSKVRSWVDITRASSILSRRCCAAGATHRQRRARAPNYQGLETRRLLVGEGESYPIETTLDTSGLIGPFTATADFGDGTTTQLQVQVPDPPGRLRFRFDYRYDTGANRFFDTDTKKELLELAGEILLNRFEDELTAIAPGGSDIPGVTNTWTARFNDPRSIETLIELRNLQINENEILVFVAGQDFPEDIRGFGGPGGFSASGSTQFVQSVQGRGQAGALANPRYDIGPWGGSVGFDTTGANFYFDASPDGLGPNQNDFLSLAVHELAHVIGFGFEPRPTNPPSPETSWERLISGDWFTGQAARDVYGGNVPLDPNATAEDPTARMHWVEGLTVNGRVSLMDPVINRGQRVLLNELEFAAFSDIGWQVTESDAVISGSHVYADDGTYPIEIQLVGAAGQLTQSLDAIISNVAPTLTAIDNQTTTAGQTLTLVDLVTISDPGFDNGNASPPTTETFQYSIDWGDGSTLESGVATIDRAGSSTQTTLASINGSHVYATAGSYTVTVQVDDGDGPSQQAQLSVLVNAPPLQDFTAQFDVATFSEGDAAETLRLLIDRRTAVQAKPMAYTISGGNGRVAYQASGVIDAGVASMTIAMTPVNDSLQQVTELLEFMISADGYRPQTAAVWMLDDENEFQNQVNRHDVNGIDGVQALDALQIINALNINNGSFDVSGQSWQTGDPRWDVSGDYQVTALDALQVINELNRLDLQPDEAAAESVVHLITTDRVLDANDWDEVFRSMGEQIDWLF
ncbi:MAG: dockerin type I domain-containing protein [Planctomycetota bacterium]